MHKKNCPAFYTLFAALFFSGLVTGVFAQKIEPSKNDSTKQCSAERFVPPPPALVGGDAFANFIKVMSLPSGERQRGFSELSNENKASVFKVRLALNFIKRPNLTREQKNLILETISAVSIDTYNKQNPELRAKAEKQSQELQTKAFALFPPNEAYEIFADLNGDKSGEIKLLKKYEELLTLPMDVRAKTLRESSPGDRSDFWRAQMIYYLAANFNRDQQEFITEIIPLLTPRAFTFPTVQGEEKNEATNALDGLESRANTLFSKNEVYAFFMIMGIHKIVLPERKFQPDSEIDLLPPYCDCNYVCWGYCTGGGCRQTNYGCGWFGDTPCLFKCE